MSENIEEPLLAEESFDDPLIIHNNPQLSTNSDDNSHLTNSSEHLPRRSVPSIAARAWVTVVILTAVNLVNYMDRFSIAGVLPEVQSFYQIDDTQSGLLTTSFVISYMCVSLLFGYLGDRWNRKLIIVLGILFWATVSLASSFIGPQHFWLFLLLRGLVGVGEASYSTIAPTIMADLFSGGSRTRALSLFYFAIPVGGGMGYILGSKVAQLMGGWQWALRVTPFFCLLLAVVVGVVVYEPSRGASDHSSYLETTPWTQDVKYLSKHKSFIFISLGFTCVSFVTGALALWTPKFLYLAILVHPAPADSANVSSIFGAITCASGLIGVVLGSTVASFLRRYTHVGDPLVCGFGLLAASPFLFMALYLSRYDTTATYMLIFIAEVFLFLNWALTADMLMYIIVPTRRASATSIQILMSHALGDAGSPPLLGKISDLLNKAPSGYTDVDIMSNFQSLQCALYVTCFVCVLAGVFYLVTSFHIHKDRVATTKLMQNCLDEDEDEEDGERNLVQP